MEAWINTSSLGPSNQTIMAKGNINYDGIAYALGLTPQGKVLGGVRHTHTFYGDGGDWSIDGIVTDTALRPNTWYHVACTIYSSRSASIYVNGALLKTGAITTSILSRPTEPLHIGSSSDYGTPAFFFRGLIDEVAIYDRALSAEEIQQHYQAGLQRHKSSDNTPVAVGDGEVPVAVKSR
jgi:hyaluronoglucosaminidase